MWSIPVKTGSNLRMIPFLGKRKQLYTFLTIQQYERRNNTNFHP